ncbi:MAG: tetraacyldisaccharide 4'-kinase, partial [Pseudomonadota bacterium]
MNGVLQKSWYQPHPLSLILWPLSLFYGFAMWLRQRLYDQGLLTSFRLPVPVVVVGNLSVGGTGKTPLIISLIERLSDKGHKVGVISRGYGGNPPFIPMVVDASTRAGESGDEPLAIFRRTGVPVAVGPDRVDSGHLLIEKMGCDLLVSDDGFQHLRLNRDIDIVVVDGARGFGNGRCLPAGPLREFPSAIHRADIIVTNGEPEPSVVPASQTYFVGDVVTRKVQHLSKPIERSISELSGQQLFAFAGLGNPDRFFDLLRDQGLSFHTRVFQDLHVYSESDFNSVPDDASVIITEKDAVKCEHLT